MGYPVNDPIKLKKDDPDLILTFSMAFELENKKITRTNEFEGKNYFNTKLNRK